MPDRRYICILLYLALHQFAFSQSSTVDLRGGFAVDSVCLGVAAPFALVALYPPDKDLRFPDSTYDFSPFEWSHMVYFPSELRDERVYDSVIYYLVPFQMKEIQTLQLSLQLVQGPEDTLLRYTDIDSLHIKDLLAPPANEEEAKLQPQLDYEEVALAFNYSLLLWIFSGASLLGGGLFLLLRRPLRRWLLRRRLRRRYDRFRCSYESLCRQIAVQSDTQKLEQALSLWKSFLEQIEKTPYRKLSTTEICKLPDHEHLVTQLKSLDRAIYSQRSAAGLSLCLEKLGETAESRYYFQLNCITYG